MKEINLTPKANEDFEDIWSYSQENFGVVKADNYIRLFSDIFDGLATLELGTQRPEIVTMFC